MKKFYNIIMLLIIWISFLWINNVSAKTMLKVSNNTYWSDTNTDIVVSYPNLNNSGSSVNIPWFWSFNNWYVVTYGSTLWNYLNSIYWLSTWINKIWWSINTNAAWFTILIVWNWEIPTGSSCYSLTNWYWKMVFFANTLNKKKFFWTTCSSTLQGSIIWTQNMLILWEPQSDWNPLEIVWNANQIYFTPFFDGSISWMWNLIIDGFFLNNFQRIYISSTTANWTASRIATYNGDYHLVSKWFANVVNATPWNNSNLSESYYSIVNVPVLNAIADTSTTTNYYKVYFTWDATASTTFERWYSKIQNSVVLNNNNSIVWKTLHIDWATIDKSVIKQYNNNQQTITNTWTMFHIRNSTITNSYIYNHSKLYLAWNNIGSSAIFNNDVLWMWKTWTLSLYIGSNTYNPTWCNAVQWNSARVVWTNMYCDTDLAKAQIYTTSNGTTVAYNNIVKSAIYNNTDASLLFNQQSLLSTESMIFNNGWTLQTYLATNLKNKFTTPDSAWTNFYFDDVLFFYTYISNSIPNSLLTSFPYCWSSSSDKWVVNDCNITTLYFKSTWKTF